MCRNFGRKKTETILCRDDNGQVIVEIMILMAVFLLSAFMLMKKIESTRKEIERARITHKV